MAKSTYYETLGVARTATEAEIKTAYRTLAREYHPDVSTAKDAEDRFKEINTAYDVLSDSLKRADYDQTLADPGVRRDASSGAPADGQSGYADPNPQPSYTPDRSVLIRAAMIRTIAAGLIAGVVGVIFQVGIAYGLERDVVANTLAFGALPAVLLGLLYSADMNFKVESFLGSGWTGRSYTFARTVLMALGAAYYTGLIGFLLDTQLETKVFTPPFLLVGILIGAVVGSDGDTPEKLRSGPGRFNLFYTLLRGAEIGGVGALIGAGLGAILGQVGYASLFGWSVFTGFAIGMIAGSIKPPNLAAYASYASASVKNIIVILMVAVALLAGLFAGAYLAPDFAQFLGR